MPPVWARIAIAVAVISGVLGISGWIEAATAPAQIVFILCAIALLAALVRSGRRH